MNLIPSGYHWIHCITFNFMVATLGSTMGQGRKIESHLGESPDVNNEFVVFTDSDQQERKQLCSSEFIYCGLTDSCLDIVCSDISLKDLNSCLPGTIRCQETDECLVNCVPTVSTTQDELNPSDPDTSSITQPTTTLGGPLDLPHDFKTNESELISFKRIFFSIKGNYHDIVGNRSREFQDTLLKQLQQIVPPLLGDSIRNLVVIQKPFQVAFDLVYLPESNVTAEQFKEIHETLEARLKLGDIFLRDLNGQALGVVKDGERDFGDGKVDTFDGEGKKGQPQSTENPEEPSNSGSSDSNSFLIILLIIGVAILMLVVIIGIVFAKKVLNQRRSRILPSLGMRLQGTGNLTVGQTVDDRMVLETREGGESVERYSYDSGVWMAPGQTGEGIIVPEAARYVPPAEFELQRTPRPATSIRNKLKEKYDIDFSDYFYGYATN